MKKIILLILTLAVLAFAASPRIEQLSQDTFTSPAADKVVVTVYHDTDSGVEFICRDVKLERQDREEKSAMSLERANSIALAHAVSVSSQCFPTGRSWKSR
jgi:hypothetical protein